MISDEFLWPKPLWRQSWPTKDGGRLRSIKPQSHCNHSPISDIQQWSASLMPSNTESSTVRSGPPQANEKTALAKPRCIGASSRSLSSLEPENHARESLIQRSET